MPFTVRRKANPDALPADVRARVELLPNDLAFCVNSGMDAANESLCSPTAQDKGLAA